MAVPLRFTGRHLDRLGEPEKVLLKFRTVVSSAKLEV